MTDNMNSVYKIAQQILDDWPYAGGIKSAHKTLLVTMIAEKLSEQRQSGYVAGMTAAAKYHAAQESKKKGWKPDTKSPYEL